jgi:hypothetical protein
MFRVSLILKILKKILLNGLNKVNMLILLVMVILLGVQRMILGLIQNQFVQMLIH